MKAIRTIFSVIGAIFIALGVILMAIGLGLTIGELFLLVLPMLPFPTRPIFAGLVLVTLGVLVLISFDEPYEKNN